MWTSGQRRPDLKSSCQSIRSPSWTGPEPSRSNSWRSTGCAVATAQSRSGSHAATAGSAASARSRQSGASARATSADETWTGRTRRRARRSGIRTCWPATRAPVLANPAGPRRRKASTTSLRVGTRLCEGAAGDPVVVPDADVVEVPEVEGPVLAAAVGRPQLVDAVVVEQPALGQRRAADLALGTLAQ